MRAHPEPCYICCSSAPRTRVPARPVAPLLTLLVLRRHQQRLIAKAEGMEVSAEVVLCWALVLVGVACVATLLPAVSEEPVGT